MSRSSDYSEDEGRGRGRDRGDRRSRGRESRRRRRSRSVSRSRSRSASASTASSASSPSSARSASSSASRERKRRKREKKHKKESRKQRRKGEKKSKKEKKRKKDKKRRKSGKSVHDASRTGAIDQHRYGAFGIIRDSDLFTKQQEFEAWRREVKGVTDAFLDRRHERELFSDFMEDYNTATMPSEKYYDVEKWERQRAEKRRRKLAARGRSDAEAKAGMRDEDIRREELARQRESEKRQELLRELAGMSREKASAMRDQERLRAQMQTAWKRGDTREAERIKRLLDPET